MVILTSSGSPGRNRNHAEKSRNCRTLTDLRRPVTPVMPGLQRETRVRCDSSRLQDTWNLTRGNAYEFGSSDRIRRCGADHHRSLQRSLLGAPQQATASNSRRNLRARLELQRACTSRIRANLHGALAEGICARRGHETVNAQCVRWSGSSGQPKNSSPFGRPSYARRATIASDYLRALCSTI